MDQKQEPGFFDGNPKMIFVFGLVTGIAITSLLGGVSFENLGSSNGSDVVRTFETNGSEDEDEGGEVVEGLAAVTGDEHILGDLENAAVVLVEYSDFQCSYCQRHHPTLQELAEKYPDDVAWVYRHFPLESIHPEATPAAMASECAADQGAFWEFGDALFASELSAFNDDLYEEIAQDLGLDMDEFTECYESEKYADAVAEDQDSGLAAGVRGTPATFVNGVMVSGAQPVDVFEEMIEEILAE